MTIERTTRLAGGLLTMDERFYMNGVEVPAARIPAERDAVATAKANIPRVVAPVDTPRRWTIDDATLAKSSQVQAIRTIFGKAIAADPDEMSGYQSRAAFEIGIGNHRAALPDLDKVIAKEPTLGLYLQRSEAYATLGEMAKALADAERARTLDPASSSRRSNRSRR